MTRFDMFNLSNHLDIIMTLLIILYIKEGFY